MNFGFSYVSLIFLLMLMIPNIIWSKNKPKDYEKYAKNENKILLKFERIGEMLVTGLSLIFTDFNIRAFSESSFFLILAFILMCLYEIYWVRYFKSEKKMSDMYSSLLGVPVAGASLPVLAFLLLGVYGNNYLLIISTIILGIGHIGIHLIHYKESVQEKVSILKKIFSVFLALIVIIVIYISASYIYKMYRLDKSDKMSSTDISENITKSENESKITTNTLNNENQVEPKNDELVEVIKYIPNIKIDLKYATTDNFVGTKIYESNIAYLRYGTVKRLKKVQEELNKEGYSLLIWDAYRSTEAQKKLWEKCPDSRYVSNPQNGGSKHSRGNTVDITLVKIDGSTIEMPTGFDDFTAKADRDYSDVSDNAKINAIKLEKIMTTNGFSGYQNEWWHYSDIESYDIVVDG